MIIQLDLTPEEISLLIQQLYDGVSMQGGFHPKVFEKTIPAMKALLEKIIFQLGVDPRNEPPPQNNPDEA